jgi:hypothetical protein
VWYRRCTARPALPGHFACSTAKSRGSPSAPHRPGRRRHRQGGRDRRVPTPLVIQTSPMKSYASSVGASTLGRTARYVSVCFGVGPGGGCDRSAAGPAVRARFSHWLTAPAVTPSASAIRFPLQPCSCSSSARSRRPFRQSRGGPPAIVPMPSGLPDALTVHNLTQRSVDAERSGQLNQRHWEQVDKHVWRLTTSLRQRLGASPGAQREDFPSPDILREKACLRKVPARSSPDVELRTSAQVQRREQRSRAQGHQ